MLSVSGDEIDALFRVSGVIEREIVGGALDLASAPALPPKRRPRKERGGAGKVPQ
jgi:hypothetical protein